MRLLQMSMSAALLIAAILVLRRVGRRLFSARFLFLLWFVALARMVLPIYIPVWQPQITAQAQEGEDMYGGRWPVAYEASRDGQVNVTVVKELYAGYSGLIFLIWADGALILMILFAWAYIRQLALLGQSIPLNKNSCIEDWSASHSVRRRVRFMYFDRITSPLTYGIWHPVIVFPGDMAFEDTVSMEHVLRHEYAHIRRFDNLWKIVMIAVLCIHWFNPLAWVMWSCFNRDMELACDERAVAGMDGNGRIAYAMSILGYAEKRSKVLFLCNGFGKSPVKERIMTLMNVRRRKRLGIICSILAAAFSLTAFTAMKDSYGSQSALAYGEEEKSPARVLSETPQFKEYETMGMYYDPTVDIVTYNSRSVGYFKDEYSGGSYNKMDDLAGSLCLEATRDESGALTGFVEVEKTDYLKRASEADRRRAQERAYIREYGSSGLTYDKETGYLSYGGKLVEAIRDSGGCGIYVNSARNANKDTTCLQIIRDENGGIREVKELTPEQMSETLHQTIGVYRGEDSWKGERSR